jgi:hypothetical protein
MIHCGQEMIGIEYPDLYDGISEWYCEVCDTRIGRWSGNVLKDDEREPRAARKALYERNS